jgi:hypothetical protein
MIKKYCLFFVLIFIFYKGVPLMLNFGLKICVFSSVSGNVIEKGLPVPNVIISREYTWDSKDYIETIKTDKNGYFSFPEVYVRSMWVLFPHNPSVSQFIKIQVGNKEYQAWGYVKGNYDKDGELYGKKMNLVCDLNNDKILHKISSFKSYMGICKIKD